jgi:hypothetical protein
MSGLSEPPSHSRGSVCSPSLKARSLRASTWLGWLAPSLTETVPGATPGSMTPLARLSCRRRTYQPSIPPTRSGIHASDKALNESMVDHCSLEAGVHEPLPSLTPAQMSFPIGVQNGLGDACAPAPVEATAMRATSASFAASDRRRASGERPTRAKRVERSTRPARRSRRRSWYQRQSTTKAMNGPAARNTTSGRNHSK